MSREGVGSGRRHVRPGGVVLVMAALALLATGACRDAATASGTALYVTAEFDPLLQLTQLRVSGDVEGAEGLRPALLPEQPGRLLQSGETFRVLLPDAPDGARVTLRLEGLSGTELAARGVAEAEVREGYEVDVQARLAPWSGPPDSGTPDSGTPDSGTPDAGTYCLDCPDGCCRNGFCVERTVQSCGVGGVDCTVCDGTRADACSDRGTCTCGGGPACSGINVDRCLDGQCRCGNSSPCGAGRACVDGECRCTPDSCPDGCCSGNTCEPGNKESKCGKGGQACQKCRRACTGERVCR